jgi:hypothetical protein
MTAPPRWVPEEQVIGISIANFRRERPEEPLEWFESTCLGLILPFTSA